MPDDSILDLTVTERAPLGEQYARFTDFTEWEESEKTEKGEKKIKIKELVSELISSKMSDGSPFVVKRRYRWDARGINNFKKDVKTWRGKPLNAAEMKAFNPRKEFIGKGAKIRVVHVAEGGTKVSRFIEFVPAPEHNQPQANPTEVTTETK